MKIIGRTNEIEILEHCYNSTQSEFVAIYGRRRIGKTFLIRELFKDRTVFYASGIFNEGIESQLAQWNREIAGFNYDEIKDADNWLDAFGNLYRSLFSNSETYMHVINALASYAADYEKAWHFGYSNRDIRLER